MLNKTLLLGLALVAPSLGALAADADPLAAYYDNTLVWQNQATKAVGRMWLNRDGRYYSFYDVGVQSVPPGAEGALVVTALATNHITPFLRWLSGDLVVYTEADDATGPFAVFPKIRHAHRTTGFFIARLKRND